MSLLLTWTYVTPFPSVSIAVFEQVNAVWVNTVFIISESIHFIFVARSLLEESILWKTTLVI